MRQNLPSSFQLEPFRPSRLWLNPHAQTILANSIRPMRGIFFRRVRLDTPDGDFLDIDFPIIPGTQFTPQSPLVLLLHGLEGNARRGYAHETYKNLAGFGIRAVGMNYRSCSGEMNRTPRLYHSGATDDVEFVVDWLSQQFPDATLGAVGFSLGANLLLKYLGEQGSNTPIQAATAVSPPFDLLRGAREFENGIGRRYAQRFLRDLQQKTENHAQIIGQKVDLEQVRQAKTVREFDDTLTAPLHGFRDANEYYQQNSCGQFIPDIRVPTLIIRAMDDPFFANDIPHGSIADNPCIYPGFTAHGGHVAFVEGRIPGLQHYWAERQAARFIAHCIQPN